MGRIRLNGSCPDPAFSADPDPAGSGSNILTDPIKKPLFIITWKLHPYNLHSHNIHTVE